MIHYALRCAAGHEFDGWFGGSAAFETQREAGLVECPVCGTATVDRALMAPNVARGAVAREAVAREATQGEAARDVGEAAGRGVTVEVASRIAARLPAEMLAHLQRLRVEVEKRCDDVGDRFAPLALAMHRGEMEHRGIYGRADAEQAEELLDEGVEVMMLPWVRPADG